MQWKEFLNPTRYKLLLTIALIIATILIVGYKGEFWDYKDTVPPLNYMQCYGEDCVGCDYCEDGYLFFWPYLFLIPIYYLISCYIMLIIPRLFKKFFP